MLVGHTRKASWLDVFYTFLGLSEQQAEVHLGINEKTLFQEDGLKILGT